MSGKTGSFTYRQSRGQTIVSQYQPSVKNPNSAGQQAQRAKFKLMSQLAAVMAEGFGTMGINERPARQRPTTRNAFVSLNMPKVTTAETANGVTASIEMDKLDLTSSSRYLGTMDEDEGLITVSTVDEAITTVRFVDVYYVNDDVTKPVVLKIQDSAVSDGDATYVVGTLGKHTVLAYGLIPTASASQATLDNLHTPSTTDFISAVQLSTLVSSGEIIETSTIGTNVTLTQ